MVKTIEQEHISGSMYREVHRDVAKLRNEQLLDCYRWVVHYTLARSIKLFITDIGSNNGRIFIWSDRCTFLLWWKVFDNSDPVFLHSHLQDCFPPVHSQDWLGKPVLPRSWTMISKCSFQDLRILRNTVYRNSDSVEIGAQNTLPNQKTAGHSIKLTWWQNPDLHSHTIDCNEDIAAITLADKSLHIIYMYVNGTEWKSSQVKEMLKKPCKPA